MYDFKGKKWYIVAFLVIVIFIVFSIIYWFDFKENLLDTIKLIIFELIAFFISLSLLFPEPKKVKYKLNKYPEFELVRKALEDGDMDQALVCTRIYHPKKVFDFKFNDYRAQGWMILKFGVSKKEILAAKKRVFFIPTSIQWRDKDINWDEEVFNKRWR